MKRNNSLILWIPLSRLIQLILLMDFFSIRARSTKFYFFLGLYGKFFLAGFIGYFGEYLGKILISRIHPQGPDSKPKMPSGPNENKDGNRFDIEKQQLKLEKKRAKLIKKRSIKHDKKNENQQ